MKTFLKNRYGQLVFLSTASIGAATAAVPAAVTTAIGDAGTDSATVASAVFVAIVGIFAVKLMRRAL